MNRGEEGVDIPGITGGDAPPAFEMQKSILHQMPQTVEIPVMLPQLPTIALRRNHRLHPPLGAVRHNGIGVISPIRQQDARINPPDQKVSLATISGGTLRNNGSDRHTMRIHGQMQFRVEPPFVRSIA